MKKIERKRETPFWRFKQQRGAAGRRGIGWEFSFEQWWQMWSDSGHWDQRGGRGGCYVMARKGDAGPYSPDNCFICTFEQNLRDARLWSPAARRTPKAGKGWTYRAGSRFKKRPYQVVFGSTYVGCYATQQEAEVAYALSRSMHFLKDVQCDEQHCADAHTKRHSEHLLADSPQFFFLRSTS